MAHTAHTNADGSRPPPTIGIVAALWIEGLAMRSLITDIESLPSIPGDPNHYYQGTLASTDDGHPHRVVVTTLPRDNTRNAAAISTDLIRSFPTVHCIIMTGIAGGVPSLAKPDRHVRLGDIVVATKGVVDYGHVIARDGKAVPRQQTDGMSPELCRAANELAAQQFAGVRPWDAWLNKRANPGMRNFARPAEHTDILYVHGQQAEHPSRKETGHPHRRPKVHYAAIGSADMLVRDEKLRDQIAMEYGVVAVEMEGSGIAVGSATHGKQWFMVRGVSDYCENMGKGDTWQPYASMVAAAYVRAVLAACHPFDRDRYDRGPFDRGPAVPGTRQPTVQPATEQLPARLSIAGPGPVTWRDQLIESLASVEFWHLVANRRNLVTILRTKLAALPNFFDEDTHAHLGQIIDACVQHDPELSALRESLADMPPIGRVSDAMHLLTTATVGDLLPPGQLLELRRLVAEAAPPRMPEMAFAGPPDPAALGDDQTDNLGAALFDLTIRPGTTDNMVALYSFVLEIARSTRSQQLETWLAHNVSRSVWLERPSTTTPPHGLDIEVMFPYIPDARNAGIPSKAGSMTDLQKPAGTAGSIPPSGRTPAQPGQDQSDAITGLRVDIRSQEPPSVWNVPPRNLNFTGREELLASLRTELGRSDLAAVLPQALHGLGGVGKTQLAIEYVYRHQSDYDVIWWIPAEQPQQILAALVDLAQQLGLKVGPEANTAVPAVKEALRRGEPYANWLLVFDNAEDADSVQQNIPTGGLGKVLVTSRNAEWMLKARSLEVDVFSREESINLLRRRDRQISNDNAQRLAEALGDLPLAIEQAAAWRAATGMAVDEYLQLLEAKRPELLGITATSGYESSVAAVWTVSLDRLEQINPTALRLLQVAAFFAPEPISRSLFTTSRATIMPELDEALRDPIKLGKALRDIQRFALAKVDHSTDTVQLHRLVQAVLIARIAEEERELFRHGAHELLAAANPGLPHNTKSWERYGALVSHVKTSDAVRCQEPWVRSLVFDIVQYLYWWGDHLGCEDLAKTVYDTWRDLLGADHPETLRVAKFYGYVLNINGKHKDAYQIFADTLARYEQIVEADDEELLDAQRMVSLALRASGKYDEALALNQRVLEACQGAFGETEPVTLRAAHDLGVSLRLCGEFERARNLDEKTIRERSLVLGPTHPETLNTINGYTIDLRECGDYRGAQAEQRKLYERYVEILGDTNPATVRAGRNLSVALRRAGDHAAALEMSRAVERLLRHRYGATSADTMAAAMNLAVDLRQSQDLPGSADVGTRVLEEYRRAMGEIHPFTLSARTNLAVTLRLMEKIEDAHAHDLAAWTGLSEALGPEHVSTMVAAINLASDKYAMGDHQGAFELDSETLELARRMLGQNHPTTLACNANLALDLRALGRVSEAQTVHSDVMARFKETLGDKHPATVAAGLYVRADCDIEAMPL